jgi:hypothetical protein
MKRYLLLGLALLLALAPGAFAQIGTGNIYGTVRDDSGAVLAGASVALSGEMGSRSTTSGPQGEFRFLNLDRGRYKMTVTLAGFTTVARELSVTSGESLTVDSTMKVAQVAETVTVTAETPLVDTKKRGTATTMTTEELQNVPNARDPWGVLKNVPGVLLDRVNIAGNENGQQAAVAGKGSDTTDKMFTLDGINITDMSATGASPTYFDFEAFQEINVATGGNDLQVQSGGIGINLVTKRGTNTFHGSGRFLAADEDWSSSNVPDDLKNDARLQGSEFADHIKDLKDWGFDLGGPIIKDKLWFYGTFGRQDIKLLRLNQTPDDTILDSYNAKLNWQAASQTMVSAFYFVGKKKKFGRSPGYPGESDDFLWNQDNAYVDGGVPGGLWKLQADHTFSPNFFVSAKAAYYDTGFGLFPRGGTDQDFTVDYVAGESIGSYETYQAIRPQKMVSADGSYFFSAMGGNNELKFGFGYRDLKTQSSDVYSGNGLGGFINDVDDTVVQVLRNGITEYGGKYVSAYLGDVFTKDRLSLNVGVRWDLQTAKNLPSEVSANKGFPNLLPALSFPGNDDNIIEWNDISPRVGLSYALDAQRKTVLRASFARYADQLSFGDVAGGTGENPVGVSTLTYGWTDRNHDRIPQVNEVDLGNLLDSSNVDPRNPTAVADTANKVDRDLKAKHDNEFIVGLDREIAPNFAVGAAFTYRRATDWQWRPRLAGPCTGAPTRDTCPIITANQYTPNPPSTVAGVSVNHFSPPAALITAGRGGRIRTNRDGYYTNFSGLEFTATKRLANKWMGRLAFSFNDWTEHWQDGVTPTTFLGNPTRVETDPLVQGGQVALLSGGSGKASFYSSVKWQVYANALVQLPWQVDVSAALFGKQGGSFPTRAVVSVPRDGSQNILVTPEVDTNRYDNVFNFDVRLAKNVKIDRAALTLSVEAFNLFNNDVVLSRSRSVGATFNRIEEIIAPRTLRLGARFSF